MEAKTVEQKNRWQRFISPFDSKATRATYRTAVKRFLRYIYNDDFITVEETVDRYFMEDRNHEEDVMAFFVSIKSRPPKTVHTWLAAVKSLLIDNDVELKQKFWRKLKRRKKGSHAVTEDIVPSNKQLSQILTHMRAKGEAFFLMLASSGMRIGEALQLQIDDIELTKDPDEKPTTIHIRGNYSKAGNKRPAFISREATSKLEEWLKIRDDRLKTAIARSGGLKPQEDDRRIFPYNKANMYVVWRGALDKASRAIEGETETKIKLNSRDTATNRHKVHPHVLRKFFRNRLMTEMPADVVEALMGHEGYLTRAYRRYSEEQLAEFYLKGEHTLLIYGTGGVSKLKQEMNDRNKELVDTITDLNNDKRKIEGRVETLESNLQKTMDYLRRSKKTADDALRGDEDIIEELHKKIDDLKKRVVELEKQQKKK